MNKAVKVHCGSSHVKGNARNYRYYVASLFVEKKTKQGKSIWVNVGETTYPRRSYSLAESDGMSLANQNNAQFIFGYGSLHNKEILDNSTSLNG